MIKTSNGEYLAFLIHTHLRQLMPVIKSPLLDQPSSLMVSVTSQNDRTDSQNTLSENQTKETS